jgi:hypothetical protein
MLPAVKLQFVNPKYKPLTINHKQKQHPKKPHHFYRSFLRKLSKNPIPHLHIST